MLEILNIEEIYIFIENNVYPEYFYAINHVARMIELEISLNSL